MNQRLLKQLVPEQVEVYIVRVEEAQEPGIEESEQGWNVELRQE